MILNEQSCSTNIDMYEQITVGEGQSPTMICHPEHRSTPIMICICQIVIGDNDLLGENHGRQP